MQFFIIVLFVSFVTFLFCLHFLTRDDFVLLRKDIALEKIFNVAILVGMFSLFSARLLYVVLNPEKSFLNPLVFLLFPYYPGLSITGGILGGVVSLLLLSKKEMMPQRRIFDFCAIAALSSMPVGFLGYSLLTFGKDSLDAIVLAFVYFALFLFFIKVLLPHLLKGLFKEGTIGLLFLVFFSVISIVEGFIKRVGNRFYLNIEDLILTFLLLVSVFFILKQEWFFSKLRKNR